MPNGDGVPRPLPRRRPLPLRPRGFAYLALIMLVALLGLVGAAGLKLGALLQRRAAEQELLAIGAQFSDALESYAAATPAGQPPQPPSLKELLRDPRFPATRRHLRRIFVDPVTGTADWGVQYADGRVGVVAVYSLSSAQPIKIGHFGPRFQGLDGQRRYSDWKFSAAPPTQRTIPPTQPATPAMPAAPAVPAAGR